MAQLFGYRFSGAERNNAARLEDRLLNLSEVSDALPACRGLEFRLGDHLFRQLAILNLALMNQVRRLTLGHAFDLGMAKQKSYHEVIDHEQRGGAKQAADDRIVITDDGILHGIRECQQDDKVKRIQLSQLAFSGQAQAANEKKIDDYRPQDFFRKGNSKPEHIHPDLMHARLSHVPAMASTGLCAV